MQRLDYESVPEYLCVIHNLPLVVKAELKPWWGWDPSALGYQHGDVVLAVRFMAWRRFYGIKDDDVRTDDTAMVRWKHDVRMAMSTLGGPPYHRPTAWEHILRD